MGKSLKTVFDYIEFYGDISFLDYEFNDVDALVFALLSYVKLEGIVPKEKGKSVTIKEASTKFLDKYSEKDFKKEDWLFPNSYKLMLMLQIAKRYQNIRLSHLILEANEFSQFGALTIRTPFVTYISFEGTDSHVVGWKEDFELIYKFPVEAQLRAKHYLEETLTFFDRNVYVGGHSKGGNLAMYAYMYAKETVKKKIKKVCNFDGPGFLKEVVDSSLYEEMQNKLLMVVPEESVVGMILEHKNYMVVKSNAKNIMQHNGYSWECFGGFLVPATLSKKSKKLESNLQEYLDGMSMEEKKNFVLTFFAIFEKMNIQNVLELKELKLAMLLKIMKELTNTPSSTKRNLVAILRMLITGMN